MGKNRDLEAAVAAVRDEAVDPLAEQGAVARVRAALGAEMSGAGGALRIEDCADVQALFAAHRREALDPARTLLVRDHLRECAVCRAEWERPGRTSVSVMPWRREDAAGPRARWGGRWIAAAAAVGAVAALTLVAYSVFWGVPGG